MTDQEQPGTEPAQQDFTLVEYVIIYQGIDRNDHVFDGDEKVAARDPREAAMRVMEGITGRDPDIAHMRTIEVQIPTTEDVMTFFKRSDPWPPVESVGPCISKGPKPIDLREAKAVVSMGKRSFDIKDGTSVLQVTFKMGGAQAVDFERALLDFKNNENLLLTIVASQTDFMRLRSGTEFGSEEAPEAAQASTTDPAAGDSLDEPESKEDEEDDF